MEPKYEATIQYNEEMLEKIHYMIYKLRTQKKIRIFCFILMVCVMIYINVNLRSLFELQYGITIIIALNIILFIAMAIVLMRETSAKVVAKNQTKKTISNKRESFQKVVYQFFEDYYIVVSSVARTEYKYDSIVDLHKFENLFVMYLDKANFLCIDFSLLKDNEWIGIEQLCMEKTNLEVKQF